ncbi:peptide chain release factor 1 [Candidatus Providencia siddallii]|uniref:Peptide chain release factor 1 n=1 Tax=Candidatus Providencia siddallii TaxID=1715285 RepID=A0ABP1CEC1_9GAMM
MKFSIKEKLKVLQERYNIIEKKLIDTNIISDQYRFRELSMEYSKISNIIRYIKRWNSLQEDIKVVETMLNDFELKTIAQEELIELKIKNKNIEKQLKLFLTSNDINDENNCFLEIRACSGGSEAAIFAGDLFRMYTRFAENKNWKIELMSFQHGEHGGFKEVIIKILGDNVYGKLKFESGGHRVQRVPETESQGRIHTSTCTVAILPELSEIESPKINLSDLRIDTFRSSGAGGQHVNTTDSAIRITHMPSGIVVECQDERSQHKNKSKAMSVLAARIYQAEKDKRQLIKDSERRNLLGSGSRSDRIRTYNFHQGRITDHRINLTLYSLNEIMSGKLDLLISPIIDEYQTDKLMELLEN